MDSLTQIVLGAAVGEVTLGKKIGNRALLWGAVAGTIPDLDVFLGGLMSAEGELASHRGFSHSITFAVLGGFLLAWIVEHVYSSKWHRYFAFGAWFLLPLGVLYFLNRIFQGSQPSYFVLAAGIFTVLALVYWLYRRYFQLSFVAPDVNRSDWQKLFFWGLVTHPLLDCFTTYGTQLFLPFSDYRVAFNSISVADPIYTAPFLLLVIILSYFNRKLAIRRRLAWAGIGISSIYLLFTVWNKSQVNAILLNSLADQNISYQRYLTSPTILNNLLWNCVVQTEQGYYQGYYSRLSPSKEVKLQFTAHQRELLPSNWENDETIQLLSWFSNDYWIVRSDKTGALQVNDMRYGTMDVGPEEEPYYIFNFPIAVLPNGRIKLNETRGGPPPGKREDMLKDLIERIKSHN